MIFVPFAAAICGVVLAFASLLRRKPSRATWCFFAGMIALSIDTLLTGLTLSAADAQDGIWWVRVSLISKSVIPAIWLAFSLTYSRGDATTGRHWKVVLLIIGLLPATLAIGFANQLLQVVPTAPGGERLQFGPLARPFNIVLLTGLVLTLMNLEQTFRATIGTMRWRIKFVVLAFAVIFGARLFVQSQAILFSAPDIGLGAFESGALLIGCAFLAIAYARTGLQEIDVYPSTAVIRSSLTVVIVGGYLFVVGVLAQVVKRFGGAEIFQFQALVVLLGLAGLAVLLLSDRARHQFHVFVGRHFSKAQHDSVRIWSLFSRQLGSVHDSAGLSATAARLISETFDALSVNVWIRDDQSGRLRLGGSSARASGKNGTGCVPSDAVAAGLAVKASPFDLEAVAEPWGDELRALNATAFSEGGNRLCVPLRAGEQMLGAIVLADRVNAALYTSEELELLKCVGDQITAVLLGLRLSSEVATARELEAFQTMSAFFVHDLKNAAASLNLMLKNLPVHFDDPAFRQDALSAIGNTARRIDDMIAGLSALRRRPDVALVRADLNELVTEALARVNGTPTVEMIRELQPLPAIFADREQIQSVVTNLVLNARDAVGAEGRIRVRTERTSDGVVLSVSDNGCGMSETFVRDALFRPFHSTKQKGLGIGLFQSRWIVQAHGGGMQVTSEPGKGTTFRVKLPVTGEKI